MLAFKSTSRTQLFIFLFCLLLGISACKKNRNNITGPDPQNEPDPIEEPETTNLEITSIDPQSGLIGTEVIIFGTNFSATASENIITFGGVEANINSASDDQLVTEVPNGATSGPVEVTVNGNKAIGPDFTVMEALPEITSVDPLSGTVGTEVIINGANFSTEISEIAITFSGAEATVSSASETELITEVPLGASSGPIEVSISGYTVEGPTFTVLVPEITSINPQSGPIGTQVTIMGENFSAIVSDNTVTFGGTEADVISASETELVAEVPENANSGAVEVTVFGNTSVGPNFTIVISNIVEAIDRDNELNTLSDLLNNSNLAATLEGDGPFSILAPTDAAFEDLDPDFLNSLTQNQLEDILSYHVISASLNPDDFTNYGAAIETIQGESVHTTTEGPRVKINNDATLGTNNSAPNGQIYKIDKLLLPDAYLDVFEITFKRYVTNKFACSCVSGRTGIQDELQNKDVEFTIFAPSNTAFFNRSVSVDSLSDGELRDLINYHIIENQSLTASDLTDGQTLTTRTGQNITIGIAGDGTININGSVMVETIDLEGINGVVHVIDTVLEPPTN